MTTLSYPTPSTVLAVAAGQVGVTEAPPGSNRTPYGAAFGLDGAPWCGIFMWWAFWRTGLDLRRAGIAPAYTPAFHAQARAHGWQSVHPLEAVAGDVVFMDFTPGGDPIEHVGFAVAGWQADLSLPTLEGNTSSDDRGSQSNGGGVFRKQRRSSCVVDVLRPPYAGAVTLGRVLVARTPPMMGEDVRQVQHLVGAVVDGIYGPKTAAAVRAWQARSGVAADGAFGPASAAAAGWRWVG